MGQREGVPRKPDPSALFAMAESLGVSSEEVLYIGDSEVDAATGNAADMDTVLVEWGFRSREELERQMHTELWQRQMKFLTLSGKGEKTDE